MICSPNNFFILKEAISLFIALLDDITEAIKKTLTGIAAHS